MDWGIHDFVLSDTFNAEVRKNYSNGLLYGKLRNTGDTVAMGDSIPGKLGDIVCSSWNHLSVYISLDNKKGRKARAQY